MSNYRSILKRVGIVLIAFGIFDFLYFWYYTRHVTICRLSSSPNSSPTAESGSLLFVFIGVFFLLGDLEIASLVTSLVTWITALILPNLVWGLVRILEFPAELWVIAFRIKPIFYSLPILMKIMAVAVAWWIYTQLRAAPVVSACVRFGHSTTSPPKLAFILGIAYVVVGLSIVYFFFTPDSAAEAQAVEVARTEYGEGYKYNIRGVGQYNGMMSACLDVYNEQEIKFVRVEWEP